MTRIVLACDPSGFGPVSKLTAIANLLTDWERIFVGSAGAYQFARRHPSSYERFFNPDEFWGEHDVVKSCDLAMVVMEPDITFGLLQAGLPVYMFDSLIESWVLPGGVVPLVAAAREIRIRAPAEGRALFASFALHERRVLAHMLATGSFAQNFPGVPQRLAELRRHGGPETTLLGSIIDVSRHREPEPHREHGDSWSMLINLGGVRCSGIEFHKNDYIVDIMEHWAERFLRDDRTCREIVLCCGRYGPPETRKVGDGRLTRQFASHDAFIGMMARADILLTAAGRTTLHEAADIGKLPILLPAQHHNQHCNITSLARIGFARLVVSLADVVDLAELPDDDLKSTAIIVEHTRHILHSDKLFDHFDDVLRRRIRDVWSLAAAEKRRLLNEINRCFSGQDFTTTIRSLASSWKVRGGSHA
jgi:hypothetical protein